MAKCSCTQRTNRNLSVKGKEVAITETGNGNGSHIRVFDTKGQVRVVRVVYVYLFIHSFNEYYRVSSVCMVCPTGHVRDQKESTKLPTLKGLAF